MVSTLVSIYFGNPRLGHTAKSKLYQASGCWSRDILNFNFFKKRSLRFVSALHSVHDFSRKVFLILYSIKWPNFILWLSLLLEISGNMCIVIACYPVCDIMSFKIYLSFLIKPFFCMGKKSEQKFKYLKNGKSCKVE